MIFAFFEFARTEATRMLGTVRGKIENTKIQSEEKRTCVKIYQHGCAKDVRRGSILVLGGKVVVFVFVLGVL